jgi:hypothetical protein
MRRRDSNGFASGIDLVEAEVGAERVGEASCGGCGGLRASALDAADVGLLDA